MDNDIVEEYLNEIEKELQGLNASEKANILIELKGHIIEKANELAVAEGKSKPTPEIYRKVTQKLGEPKKIGEEYLKISGKNVTIKNESMTQIIRKRKMLYFAGALTIAIGVFMSLFQRISETNQGYYSEFIYVPLSWGIIVLGIIIIAYARWIHPSQILLQMDGRRKLIYFFGLLLIAIGSFLTLYRTPGDFGTSSTFPFMPWSLVIILIGIFIVAYTYWIYPTEG